MLNRSSLLPQHDKQILKAVEKLFKPHSVDGIYSSKPAFLKNFSIFYSKIEHILRSSDESTSLMYQSDRTLTF